METIRKTPGLARLLAVQAQVAFNDNAAKLLLIGLAGFLFECPLSELTGDFLSLLLVLPFVLLAPLCGWLADRFPKTAVIRGALLLQAGSMAALTASLLLHRFAAATFCFLLVAVLVALFSPAKQGIVKEWVGSAGLARAVGAMEALTLVGVLGGGFAGGFLLDAFAGRIGDAWTAAAYAASLLTAGCLVSLALFRSVPQSEEHRRDAGPFRAAILWEHVAGLRRLGSRPALLGAATGIAWFYGLGGVLYLFLVGAGRRIHPGMGAASSTGWYLLLLGGGVVAGALLYGKLSKGRLSLRGAGGSAAAMALLLALLAATETGSPLFQAGLFALGLAGGTFTIPLNAFLQDGAGDGERGRILASSNLLTNVAGVAAVGVHYGLISLLGVGMRGEVLILASSAGLVAGLFLLAAQRKLPKTVSSPYADVALKEARMKTFFSFNGRATRRAFWLTLLPASLLFALGFAAIEKTAGYGATWVLYPPFLWIVAAVGTRRLRDRGLAPAWFAAVLVPVLGPLWLGVELGLRRGSLGENRYGPDPRTAGLDYLTVR